MQSLFKRWLASHWDRGSAAFELKRTTERSIPWSAVKPHQEEALVMASKRQLYYKIPDDSYGQKPFDCFVLQKGGAYVVVAFGQQLRSFYIIDIDTWLSSKKQSTRASLTEEQAAQIALLTINLRPKTGRVP